MAASSTRRQVFTHLKHLSAGVQRKAGHPALFVPLVTFASSGKENASAAASESWLQKLKGFWVGKDGSMQQKPQQPSPTASEEQFTLESFADQLKQARQFGKMTRFGRGLPRGGEAIAQRSLERQEQILRKLAGFSSDGKRLGAQHKSEVAVQCECTVRDVEDVLGKYEWTREANDRIMKLKREGKPLPKSLDEIEKLMGGRWKPSASVNLSKDGQHSRNALCPCGSGKKYKRCCGKD